MTKKNKDLKAMGAEELKTELEKSSKELVSERASTKQTGKSTNPGAVKSIRKKIARIKTFLKQKGISV
ncbi:50S ribosomal protein L29 [Candidatus Micrarchaeota archaeon]|nr:50S ribosomal protein L29 [Candidatus Micrarchaeota archaeon]